MPPIDNAAPPADAWGERLERRLGLWSCVAILVGSTIGSGIFRVPAGIAEKLGAPEPFLLAWVLGGVITLAGALTIAEAAATLPRSGGVFAFLLEAFGPLPAFLFGWSELTVVRASALGAIATLFAEYLVRYFVPLPPEAVRWVAAAAILLVAFFNWVGVERAAGVMNVVTVAKYVALGGLVLLAFASGQGSAAHFASAPGVTPTFSVTLIATALVSIMWTYDGWADLSFMGGEVKDPQRTLPLALLMGTGAIILIYLLLNAAYLYLLPIDEMATQKLVASAAAERITLFGPGAGIVVAGVVVLSAFGSLNGSMMTGPRIFFAMADQGLFFRGLARVSPRFGSPSVSIWFASVLGVAYVLLNDFQQLAEKFVLGIWPFYAGAVAAVFVFRRRPGLSSPYRTWGWPVTPLLFLAASLFMVVNALLASPVDTGITFAIIGAGVPAYYAWRRKAAGGR